MDRDRSSRGPIGHRGVASPRQARRGTRLVGALLALAVLGGLIPAAAQAQTPARTANGKIAFVSFRDGDPEVYTMNPDGTQPTRLTFNAGPSPELPFLDFWPSWSPDGARIVFTSFTATTACTASRATTG